MKSVVLTSAILSLAAVVYSPEVNASSIPDYVSNSVTEQNINMAGSNRHISTSNKCSQDTTTTNTNYQLTSGDFLIYFFIFYFL